MTMQSAQMQGDLYHVGIVVADLDVAMEAYRRLLGVTAFYRLDTSYRARFGDWTGTITNRNAFARVGNTYFEIIEPGEGEGPQGKWLRERGPGVFHVGLLTSDPTQAFPDAEPVFEVLDLEREDGTFDIVYLDTVDTLGYYVELVAEHIAERLCRDIDESLAEQAGNRYGETV